MKNFNAYMTRHMLEWRRKHISTDEQGWWMGKQYPFILPHRLWEQGLWPGIRSDSDNSLFTYLEKYEIQPHTGVHNLKSSWVLCANMYFPFRASTSSRAVMAGFLKEHVDKRIETVDTIELEYAEEGDLHPVNLLGEPGGVRGTNQTSPDFAILVNGGKGLVLIENKLCEHSFYPCAGKKSKSDNPDRSRCNDLDAIVDDNENTCHLNQWGRKYWQHLLPVTSSVIKSLKCCPAATGGYQLFRQQALAEGIAASGKYEFVISAVALDKRNEDLLSCLKTTGMTKLQDWSVLFPGQAQFRVFDHQGWIDWVNSHGRKAWSDWLSYNAERYGYDVSCS